MPCCGKSVDEALEIKKPRGISISPLLIVEADNFCSQKAVAQRPNIDRRRWSWVWVRWNGNLFGDKRQLKHLSSMFCSLVERISWFQEVAGASPPENPLISYNVSNHGDTVCWWQGTRAPFDANIEGMAARLPEIKLHTTAGSKAGGILLVFTL